jgi:PAS domain S-box-containing protein
MATSPDYLRLATSSTLALADTALDSLRDAVVIVDARHKHLPVVLANATARGCLATADAVGLIESPLHGLLAAASASTIETTLAALADPRSPTSRVLEWRCVEGEISVMTDIKPLAMVPGQRLVMLTFAPAAPDRNLSQNSDRRLLALTEHARDIITVAAPDGKLQYVSGGIRNSLGYTSEERQSYNPFELVHPDDYEALRAKYQQLVDGEIKIYSHEFRARHKEGSYRWLESSYTSALDNPLIGGVVINSRDITERKLAEFRLAQRGFARPRFVRFGSQFPLGRSARTHARRNRRKSPLSHRTRGDHQFRSARACHPGRHFTDRHQEDFFAEHHRQW